jgi:FixJ family two-component response regulator
MTDPHSSPAKPGGLPRDHRRSPVESAVSQGSRRGLLSLTPRERDVLTRLTQGKTNRQIAIALNASAT